MKIDYLTLNFLDRYYMFYEWLESDDIEKFHQVNLYKVSSKTICEFINHKFKVETNILDGNPLCFSDGFSFVAIEFDKDGNSIYKSSLSLEDELKLSNIIDSLKVKKINYEVIDTDKKSNDLRINEEIRQTINMEMNNITQTHNLDKLESLYYEWFSRREKDFNKMIKDMKKRLNFPLTEREKLIFDIIKKSYRLV